ncbi:ComEC/Rec2 family competence protein [uncultured Phascolarctobacterium sp.]|uniref:ComEC/Rec2 family competence protein n=1 Tax=uncultured Phascolarctobacterium sp. TaxID=512296 RepID=UPI0025DF13D0|nr:ComEC/Rec2 family competence protein [uncultured Phascolarctobacterium sp.]
MKKSDYLKIFLVVLVLAAGITVKDSAVVKQYLPVLLAQVQSLESEEVTPLPQAEAKQPASQKADKLADGILLITALDVGQGDSILVQTRDKNILIDSGERKEASKLLEKLEDNKVEQLDMLVATHPHADHIGGMKAVLNRFLVKQVYDSGQSYKTKMYGDFRAQVEKDAIPFEVLRGGQEIAVNEMVKLKVLSPRELYKGTASDANNNSLVLRLEYDDFSMLLTGDIQAAVEEDLLKNCPQDLAAQVLKVAHHGSKTSSINEFLAAVRPKVAIISSGNGNKYNHPSPEVVRRLNDLQADVFNTAVCGDVIIKSNGKTCDITVEKFYDEQQMKAA